MIKEKKSKDLREVVYSKDLPQITYETKKESITGHVIEQEYIHVKAETIVVAKAVFDAVRRQ